jgi:hypothetical protein
MPKLSTPSHPCEIVTVDANGVPLGRCGHGSHRRDPSGKWLCITHRRLFARKDGGGTRG